MEIKKPILSDNAKLLANKVYVFLRTYKGYHTKEEICDFLGWEYPKMDRQVRDVISNLAKVKPIISTSDSRGYKLAQDESDIEEVQHQINELQKRADEILNRTAPLVNFVRSVMTITTWLEELLKYKYYDDYKSIDEILNSIMVEIWGAIVKENQDEFMTNLRTEVEKIIIRNREECEVKL